MFYPIKGLLLTILFSFLLVNVLAQTSSDYKFIRSVKEDSLLNVIRASGSDSVRAELYANLMSLSLMTRPEKALHWYAEGVEYAERFGHTDMIMRYRLFRMVAWNKLGRYQDSDNEAQRYIGQLQQVKKPRIILGFYLEWAHSSSRLGRYEKAVEYYQKVIALAREYKQPDVEITALNNFSVLYNENNKMAEMKDLLFQVIELAQRHKFRAEEIMGKFNLGLVESNLGNYGKALAYFTESQKVFDSLNNRYGLSLCYGSLGTTYRKLKRYDEALESLRKAQKIRMEMGETAGVARVNASLAQLFLEMGALDSGLVAIGRAIPVFDSTKNPVDLENALKVKADLLARKNDFANAYKTLEQHNIWRDTVTKRTADKELQQQILKVKASYTDSLALARQVEASKAKSTRNLLAIATAILLLVTLGLYARMRKKKPDEAQVYAASEKIRLLETELASVKAHLDEQVKFQWSELQERLSKEGDWTESYWNEFLLVFTRTYPDFFAKLKEQFPDLSQHELRICALVKLNLTQQDMVDILGISVESVRKARYRIYKKMGLGSDQELVDRLLKMG